MSTRQPAGQIQHAGAETPAAGVNPKKCGSTNHQRSPNRSRRYPYFRPPEWQPRSDTFPESHRDDQARLRPLYREYLQSRINIFKDYDDRQRSNSYFQQSVKLQGQIWDIASASVLQDKNPGIISLVLGSTGDMMDVANERLQATRTHPPVIVYVLLFALALASAFMVGQDMSVNEKRPLFYMIIFCVTISLITFIIIDLENPRVGLTRINIQADKVLVETLENMN